MTYLTHAACWVQDLEKMKAFYCTYFDGQAGALYQNPKKGFSSYFLSFQGGARLELMHRTDIPARSGQSNAGWAHLAFAVGSTEKVDSLTARLRQDGYTVADGPRTTGDGYYESVILDPEGNQVEITI
jgi:lactoylglutathione lyase